MSTSLRLAPGLEADARAEAARLGVSMNALVAFALDFYLSGRAAMDQPKPVGIEPQTIQDVTPKAITKAVLTGPQVLARQREGYDLTKPEKTILRAWRESENAK